MNYPAGYSYFTYFGSWVKALDRGGYPRNQRGLKPGQRPACHGGGFVGASKGERKSTRAKTWKQSVIERDCQCSICGSKDGLIAHHVLGFGPYPTLRTNMMNGYTVCPDCHKAIHRGDVSEEILEELTMLKINLLNSLLK